MNSRPVTRCVNCNLNQFETTDGKCRRCRYHLSNFPKVVALPLCQPSIACRTNLLSIIGNSVYTYRRCRELSQTELQYLTGILHGSISRLENGEWVPTIPVLERLAAGLGIPTGWLLESSTIEREAQIFSEQVMKTLKHIECFDRRKRIIFDAVSKLMVMQKAERRAG